MAGLHGCVLWSFLMVLYAVVSLPDSGRGETSWSAVLLGFIAKGVALACGMLMMLIGASAGKRRAWYGALGLMGHVRLYADSCVRDAVFLPRQAFC